MGFNYATIEKETNQIARIYEDEKDLAEYMTALMGDNYYLGKVYRVVLAKEIPNG